MHPRPAKPWPTYLLAALCVGAIVAAVLVVGPASGSQTSTGRTITVGQGVVQSTVSGSGNIQAATQLDLGFKTAGVVTHIYVTQGAHVTTGQLLAELDPKSAEVTLEQAKASLQAAEANLVQEEETDGEGVSGSGASATGSAGSGHATASAASLDRDVTSSSTIVSAARSNRAEVSYGPPATVTSAAAPAASTTPATTAPAAGAMPPQTGPTQTGPTQTAPTQTSATSTTLSPATTAPAHAPTSSTTPSRDQHARSRAGAAPVKSGAAGGGNGSGSATGGRENSRSSAGTDGHESSNSSTAAGERENSNSSTATGGHEGTGSSTSKATLSTAAREANIASARAAVKSDRLTVQSAAEALSDTKLFAPTDGTLVSLSGEVGEAVSASGTTRSSGDSTSSTGSGSSAAAGREGASAAGASASGSAGSSSASSPFAVLSNLGSMQLVVPLSESEVIDVRAGQPATVTIEALEGQKLAAHVLEVATLPTTSSGVVSYDVTFQLDQLAGGLKPGMSATAEVVVKQAEGVNVPTSAITADTVTVVHGGTQTRRRVVTGLAGDSSTVILSGLNAGEQIVLPVARTGTTSSLSSRLGSRLGALGGAGGLGGGGGGGAAFFGGGGGFRGG